MMTREEIREELRKRLQKAGIDDFEYETWALMEWKLGVDRAEYFMEPQKEVSLEQYTSLCQAAGKREKRVPLQYLMGYCEFMGYSFAVDERVLIPRQDTECLVELAGKYIQAECVKRRFSQEDSVRVLDLCTGSGCIGISIKLLCPEAEVTLADISGDALAVAEHNAGTLGADVALVQGDLFNHIEGKFDYILSNPPYIPTKVIDNLMPEVRMHEPRLALDGTEDGLYFYKKIVKESVIYLSSGGRLMFEIGAEQGEALADILSKCGFTEIKIEKDLAGLNRIALGRRP